MPSDQKVVRFPLPPCFWDHPGNVPSFRLWAIQFDNYIFSMDSQRMAANRTTDEFKNHLLFSLLGMEGIASFTYKGQSIDTTSFADFYATAKKHFQPTTSPIHTFFYLQSRKQHEGESASQFCTVLQTLLVDCEVHNEEECKKLLGRQLVFGCRDSTTLEKLLTLREMSFETIFAEMESQEKVNENARVIHGGVLKGRMSVCVAQKGKNSTMPNKQKGSKMSDYTVQAIICFDCGKPGHCAYMPNCPAKQAQCGLCHWVGHYKVFCHSKGHSSTP